MNLLQIRKLKMYLAIRVLLRANPDILAKLPNAQEYLTALDAAILDIQTYSAKQQQGIDEILDLEKKQKALLIADLMETQRRIQAYAAHQKIDTLLNMLKLSENYLNRLEDVKLIEFGKSIHSKANELLTDLSLYGITPITQTALLNDITQYETLIPQISNAKQDKKDVTGTLSESYKNADNAVSNLDKQVELVHISDPKFYADYKALRKVYVPTGVMQLVAKIMDAETGAGIPNATVTLTQTDATAEPIVKQTADKGGFQIKSVPNGIYSVTVVKLGYLTQTLNLTLPGDEPYYLEVRMVKNS